jgi:hypothetical protein
VFVDINGNGVYNAGIDRPVTFQTVRTTSGNNRAVTDTSGAYQLFLETGNITANLLLAIPYYNSSPASHSFNFTNYGNNAPDKNFIYTQSQTANDLEITISALSGASWSRPSYLLLTYKNPGTTTLSGTVKLKLDPRAFYISSVPAPSFTTTDSLAWNFSNLQPFETRTIHVTHRYQPQTSPISVFTKAYIDPTAGDQTPENNFDTVRQTATGPFDPNDKLSNPINQFHKDSVTQDKALIDYVIRFQNTGSDTAFQVKIIDTLSSLLNTGSLKIVAASHYCLPTIKNNVLEFVFPNISLPDSNVNELASHGFVHVQIKPLTSVQLTDSIYNRADIYFDYNPAIRTNKTAIGLTNTVVTGINNPPVNTVDLKIFPNPASDLFVYKLTKSPVGSLVIRIYDIQGRIIFSRNIAGNGSTISGDIPVKTLPKGQYIMEIRSKTNRFAKEFVLQ